MILAEKKLIFDVGIFNSVKKLEHNQRVNSQDHPFKNAINM